MSSHRVSTLSTAHPEPLCVHFSSSSRMWGKALSSASLISLAPRRASCLWRSTGSVYSSLPSGLPFRSWTLRASWNFTPLKATTSSVSFFVDLRAPIIEESSWVCTEKMPLGGIHLPSPQEFPYCPWGLAKDELIRLFIFVCFVKQV